MGLDPGIDHMSAMQIIHRIQHAGGKIISFLSHTGGLVAPESDDNHGIIKSAGSIQRVKAGATGAVYKEAGEIKKLNHRQVFEQTG
jgi:hypothetical protein